MTRVVVVGGGIAGLATAFELQRGGTPGVEVLVLEAAARAGGNLRSEHADGYICEWGPNGFLDNAPDTRSLIDRIGLTGRLLVSNDAARRRFLYRGGRLHRLPENPLSFLTSGLLSARGRLRVFAEPFAASRPSGDETIHAFAARRIGREASDVLIDSMVSGIFGGDARTLSLRACFPKMWQMETEHGGLVRAMLARRRQRRGPAAPMGAPAGRLTSFIGGIQDLVDRLAEVLGPSLRVGTPVVSLRRDPDARGAGAWRVVTKGGDAVAADAVVLAGSAASSARIVCGLDEELHRTLAAIPSAPLAVVALGYDRVTLGHPLDGFGFLVPRMERQPILGALWDSSIYPNRAPAGRALIRVMLGGAHDPACVAQGDPALIAVARGGLRQAMGIVAEPVWTRVLRHVPGIPQYTVGHLDRLAAIDARLAQHRGLFLTGNSYRGVAINACITDAGSVAGRVARVLSR